MIHSNINMKNGSTCLPGKKGYIFRGNYKNFMLSRLFIVSFLSLFIFFLQDKCKLKNNISSEFQFKCKVSRILAEIEKENEGNKNADNTLDFSELLSSLSEARTSDKDSGETVSYLEFLPKWNEHRAHQDEFLQDFSTDLFHKFIEFAVSHRIDSDDKDEFCSRILGNINDTANSIKVTLKTRLDDLFINGSCTKEECERFLQFSRQIWGRFRDMSLKYFKENLNKLYYNTD
ncbi:Plasmodium exported protein (PHIST), unknown function [Plasmodium relictum]|uniref:Plasmodium RESA N-terminal domain-containing protein n=1 Tax=Plasmodium relictum TaxID=85471 RepID=A0A1J1GK46_PLARL|nr:Plasmodium exported protein (PHIST), unknown function [Plasmodium relictum]CRG84595.1 Plasmodium exported protein (PHIST), unknown function [Plasmodium relictum]